MSDIQEQKSILSLSNRFTGLISILLFFVIGFAFSASCLCPQGAIKGRFSTILLVLILSRISWGIYKKSLNLQII